MVIIENTYVYEVSGGFVQPLFKTDTSYGKTDAEGGPAIGGSIVKIMSNTTIKRADGGSKAAAIGTRFWTAGSSITIDNSALLDIRGGNASAGIGGSRPIDAGSSTTVAETIDISINNSKITVVGGYYGAGIGSGYDTHCGTSGYCDLTIRIMGFSDITATGGVQAASIGTGFHSAVLKGGIEDTVVFNAADGTDYKSGATYSLLAQSVGYGVVDSSREAKGLLDSNGVPVQVDFTIGGAVITNPFDPDRLAAIEAGH